MPNKFLIVKKNNFFNNIINKFKERFSKKNDAPNQDNKDVQNNIYYIKINGENIKTVGNLFLLEYCDTHNIAIENNVIQADSLDTESKISLMSKYVNSSSTYLSELFNDEITDKFDGASEKRKKFFSNINTKLDVIKYMDKSGKLSNDEKLLKYIKIGKDINSFYDDMINIEKRGHNQKGNFSDSLHEMVTTPEEISKGQKVIKTPLSEQEFAILNEVIFGGNTSDYANQIKEMQTKYNCSYDGLINKHQEMNTMKISEESHIK